MTDPDEQIDLEPKDWHEYYPHEDTPDNLFTENYISYGQIMRGYRGELYFHIGDGWVPLTEFHNALAVFVEAHQEVSDDE